MRLLEVIRVTRGIFWFLIGTGIVITGVIMTIGSLIGGYDHEWYVGPFGIVVGGLAAGYPGIYRVWSRQRQQ